MNRYRLILAVVSVAVITAFVGPSWARPSDQQRDTGNQATPLETYGDVVEEYREALNDPTLEFPAGVSIPDSPSVPGDADEPQDAARRSMDGDDREMDDDGSRYERGYGDVEAANVWRCSWEVDMLNAFDRDDAQEVQRAANKLSGWYDLAIVQSSVVDPGHQWYEDVVTTALQGNARNLRTDVNINCPSNVR